MSEDKKNNLTLRIIVGMIAGLLVGGLIKAITPEKGDLIFDLGITTFAVKGFFVDGIFTLGGDIFIKSLKMLVVPLVFVSLVCGVCNLNDTSKLGRLGGKAIALYLSTTAIAITLAISAAVLIEPGKGVEQSAGKAFDPNKEAPSLVEVLSNMFPDNPFESFANGEMLQVIAFALLFGIALALSGSAGERLSKLFDDLNTVIMKLVTILMNLAPYGVFCLIAKTFSEMDYKVLGNLAIYFGVVVGVLLLHAFVTYSVLLKAFARVNLRHFYTKMKNTALFAFSTSSSSATMPVTLETATKKLGVKNSVASFTVPLGATINMDGTAIMQGVATVFIAQLTGFDLSLIDYLTVILTATLASIGTAGVPGVGMVMLIMVLNQVGLPNDAIGMLLAVDRLLDMTRTAVNVTGDCAVSCIVAKSENALDEDVFNNVNAGNKDENIDFHHLKS